MTGIERLDEWVAPGYAIRPSDVPSFSCEAVEEPGLMNVRRIDGTAVPADVIRPGGPPP